MTKAFIEEFAQAGCTVRYYTDGWICGAGGLAAVEKDAESFGVEPMRVYGKPFVRLDDVLAYAVVFKDGDWRSVIRINPVIRLNVGRYRLSFLDRYVCG